MKILIIFLLLISSSSVFATRDDDMKTLAVTSVGNVAPMFDIVNSIFTQNNYTDISTVPTSGTNNVSVLIKGSWLGGTDGTDDFTATFQVAYSIPLVVIPVGFPNAGQAYTRRVTLYALDHKADLGCTAVSACVIIDFDSSLKRGHLIQTNNGTGATDADGVEIFNSLFEAYWDKSISGKNYVFSKMLDKNIVQDVNDLNSQFVLFYLNDQGVTQANADTLSDGSAYGGAVLNFTNFAVDLASGSTANYAKNLFGLP